MPREKREWPHDPRELQKLSAAARNKNLTPEDRSAVARRAALVRWYIHNTTTEERIDGHLATLAGIITQAAEAKDKRLLLRALSVAATYERIKVQIEHRKPSQPKSIEIERAGEEAAKRFEEGRRGAIEEITKDEGGEPGGSAAACTVDEDLADGKG
jgi:hypothetical protein